MVPEVQTEQKEQRSPSEEESPDKVMWKRQTVAQVGQVRCGPQKALCTCCYEEVAFIRAVLVGLGGSQTREGPEVAGGGDRGRG